MRHCAERVSFSGAVTRTNTVKSKPCLVAPSARCPATGCTGRGRSGIVLLQCVEFIFPGHRAEFRSVEIVSGGANRGHQTQTHK